MKGIVSILLALALAAPAAWAQTPARDTAADAPCRLCLFGPDNMVFDAADNLYLVDSDHKTRSRVLKISPRGRVLADWRVFATVPGRRNGPDGITLDGDGNILVADAGSLRVLKLSPDGKLLATLGATPGTFGDLGHVAVAADGDIYVAEAARDRIQKFSSKGERIAIWQRGEGPGRGQWNHPQAIAIQPDGDLVVQDWGNRRIEILAPSGRTLRTFGRAGRGPEEFANTSGLCVDGDGNIYVSDYALNRIQEFDSRGRLLAVFGNTKGQRLFEQRPGAVAIDHRGNLYSPDGLSVVKYSRSGTFLARWR